MSTWQKNPQPARGKYLLAGPFLQDPNFSRSVVLLTDHDEQGTVGFVLNRPSGLLLPDLVAEVKGTGFDAPVFLGGPVRTDTLHFIHLVGGRIEGAIEIGKGVFAGGDFDRLFELIQSGDLRPDQFRFFVGYAGWSPGQLQEELDQSSWIVSPARKRFTFSSETDSLWKNILCEMGDRYRFISDYPQDPSDN